MLSWVPCKLWFTVSCQVSTLSVRKHILQIGLHAPTLEGIKHNMLHVSFLFFSLRFVLLHEQNEIPSMWDVASRDHCSLLRAILPVYFNLDHWLLPVFSSETSSTTDTEICMICIYAMHSSGSHSTSYSRPAAGGD